MTESEPSPPPPPPSSDALSRLLSRLEEDLIFMQILTRLPPKTLTRFQLVCKKWKTLISSPKFAKWAVDCSSESNPFACLRYCFFVKSPHSLKILDCAKYDDVSFNVDDSDVEGLIELDDLGFEFKKLIGSCNGLLCFAMYRASGDYKCKWSRFYVYNPTTRLHFAISNPLENVRDISASGFGYLDSSNDYAIVVVGKKKGLFYVFSLNCSEWRSLKCSCEGMSGSGVFVNGKLHWVVNRGGKPWEKCVLVVDVGDGSCEEVTLIPKVNVENRLCVIGNRLHLWTADMVCGEMWVLKQYGEWESWTKVFSIDMMPGLEHPCRNCFGVTKSGKILVHCDDRLVLVDLHHRPHRHVSLVKGVLDDSPVMYVESLVSPFPAF